MVRDAGWRVTWSLARVRCRFRECGGDYPAETLRLIDKHGVTWLLLVPTMMLRIWRLPEAVRRPADVSSLEVAFHLAAPCPAWLKQAWIDWLGPERVFELYGGTELQAITVITGTEWLAHRGSVGRPVVGEMEIRDFEGRLRDDAGKVRRSALRAERITRHATTQPTG